VTQRTPQQPPPAPSGRRTSRADDSLLAPRHEPETAAERDSGDRDEDRLRQDRPPHHDDR
jgi:hypothetical protein